MLLDMISCEQTLYDRGIRYVAGIDEVGKGPLAGPLVVCAAVVDLEKVLSIAETLRQSAGLGAAQLGQIVQHFGPPAKQASQRARSPDRKAQRPNLAQNNTTLYNMVNDSKKVTDKRRRLLKDFLRTEIICHSIIEIPHDFIDRKGMVVAVQKAFFESIQQLRYKPDHVLTDFVHIRKLTQKDQTNIPKGDSISFSVAAASIIAKVHRDDIMITHHETYPEYGFHQHKGYGTKGHIEALTAHGPCKIHRRSFEPIKSMIKH